MFVHFRILSIFENLFSHFYPLTPPTLYVIRWICFGILSLFLGLCHSILPLITFPFSLSFLAILSLSSENHFHGFFSSLPPISWSFLVYFNWIKIQIDLFSTFWGSFCDFWQSLEFSPPVLRFLHPPLPSSWRFNFLRWKITNLRMILQFVRFFMMVSVIMENFIHVPSMVVHIHTQMKF